MIFKGNYLKLHVIYIYQVVRRERRRYDNRPKDFTEIISAFVLLGE
jgi:hypothetical protein